MKIGFKTYLNKKTNEHNKYRHLIIYKMRKDRSLDIKISIPLFVF